MKKSSCLGLLVLLASFLSAPAHEPITRVRSSVNLPDIPGYLTLKCDFHIHTVFSDGLVWPTVRSEEAWREGLDVIAITDHIEYQPHKADMVKNHNRAQELARQAGDPLKLVVVHGSEITRAMPPGHLNAIFLTNSTPLETPKWQDAINAAHEQKAFIFWNHPGWDRQITNNQVVWYPEHTELLEAGKLHGIEVVNGRDYYPDAHRWALEKELTMLSNSDIHQPIGFDYHVHTEDHRPLTLVFARERTAAAVREALFARRTAVYSANRLIGEEQFIRPLFEGAISFDQTNVVFQGNKPILLQVSNSSDVNFELESTGSAKSLQADGKLTLVAGKTVLLEVRPRAGAGKPDAQSSLEYRVNNLLVAPGKPLVVKLPVTFGGK